MDQQVVGRLFFFVLSINYTVIVLIIYLWFALPRRGEALNFRE